jgi:hypothetical protein
MAGLMPLFVASKTRVKLGLQEVFTFLDICMIVLIDSGYSLLINCSVFIYLFAFFYLLKH